MGGRAQDRVLLLRLRRRVPRRAQSWGFAAGGTRKVLLSWDMGPTRFTEWSAGEHDGYLDQIAAAARAYPHQTGLRAPVARDERRLADLPAHPRPASRVHGGT